MSRDVPELYKRLKVHGLEAALTASGQAHQTAKLGSAGSGFMFVLLFALLAGWIEHVAALIANIDLLIASSSHSAAD